MNSLISKFLDEYYSNPDPQYAVFLKGHWGCGKTHFIKQWLNPYLEGDIKEESDIITIEPIYVSLFGLRSIDDITIAIDREINPFFYTKTGKVIKGLANVIGRAEYLWQSSQTNAGSSSNWTSIYAYCSH